VVEKKLQRERGVSRQQLGREAFLTEVRLAAAAIAVLTRAPNARCLNGRSSTATPSARNCAA